jgi:hypothetical protein
MSGSTTIGERRGIRASAKNFWQAGILWRVWNVFGVRQSEGQSMPLMLVSYRVKQEKIEENQSLIGEVFRELQVRSPPDVRYLVLRLSDGTFCHLVEDAGKTIASLEAFAAFRHGGEDRRIDAPRQLDATIVGDYRMLVETLSRTA